MGEKREIGITLRRSSENTLRLEQLELEGSEVLVLGYLRTSNI